MKTLADRTQAFLADPFRGHNLRDLEVPRNVRETLAPGWQRLRRHLRTAKRFTLDNGFVREAVRAANVMPDVLLRRVDLAMLPFDSVWFEWDQRVRVHEQAELGTMAAAPNLAGIPPMAGFLVYRSANYEGATVSPGDWLSHSFGDAVDAPGEAAISSVCHSLNAADKKTFFDQTLALMGATGLERAEQEILSSGWGYRGRAGSETAFNKSLDALFERGSSLPDVCWALPMASDAHPQGLAIWKLFEHDVQEQAGDLRFLVTVLAMINCVPVEYVHRAAKGRFTKRLNSMDYLDTHTVTLHAGRAKVVNILEREATAAGQRHKRHEVRGFWALAEHAPRGTGHLLARRKCLHLPLESDGKRALCGVCGKHIVWVDTHERGDAALGWVNHNYAVTSK